MPKQNTIRALTTVALDGYSLEINADDYTLMAISQIAAALRPGSVLTVNNAEILTPLEKACIVTASDSRVVFSKEASSSCTVGQG